jgi:hypothetical protein
MGALGGRTIERLLRKPLQAGGLFILMLWSILRVGPRHVESV